MSNNFYILFVFINIKKEMFDISLLIDSGLSGQHISVIGQIFL